MNDRNFSLSYVQLVTILFYNFSMDQNILMNIKCIFQIFMLFFLFFYSSILSSPMNMNSYTFLCQTYEQVRVLDRVNISIGFFFRMQTTHCYKIEMTHPNSSP